MTQSNFTKLEDMSETERQSWATLLVDVAVFFWFLRQTLVSFGSFELRPMEASDLFAVYIGLIVVTVVLHIIIESVFAMRRRADDQGGKDERDIDISRRGASAGFWVVTVAINVIIFVLLSEYAKAQGATVLGENFIVPLTVLAPPAMFFALMSVMFIGDIVKNAVMVIAYRGP